MLLFIKFSVLFDVKKRYPHGYDPTGPFLRFNTGKKAYGQPINISWCFQFYYYLSITKYCFILTKNEMHLSLLLRYAHLDMSC